MRTTTDMLMDTGMEGIRMAEYAVAWCEVLPLLASPTRGEVRAGREVFHAR